MDKDIQILLIPDVHGRYFWKGPVKETLENTNAKIVFLGDYINIGFRICLPIFCAMLITNCVLGIMAKVAPQMNMFAVGIQIKLLMGLMVMFLTVGMLPYISDFIFTEMKTMIVSFVEALMA